MTWRSGSRPPAVTCRARALEALALEEYMRGQLTKPELRRLLGFGTRDALDGFLKAHGLFEPYSLDDLARERDDLERLGF